MWVDKLLTFADAGDLSQSQGNAIFGDVIDVDTLGLDVLNGDAWVECRWREKLDSSGGAATCVIQMKSDSTEDLATSATVLFTGPTVTEEADGDERAGGGSKANALYARFRFPQIPVGDQYVGFWYTIGGETSTKGTMDIYVVPNPDIVKIAT